MKVTLLFLLQASLVINSHSLYTTTLSLFLSFSYSHTQTHTLTQTHTDEAWRSLPFMMQQQQNKRCILAHKHGNDKTHRHILKHTHTCKHKYSFNGANHANASLCAAEPHLDNTGCLYVLMSCCEWRALQSIGICWYFWLITWWPVFKTQW